MDLFNILGLCFAFILFILITWTVLSFIFSSIAYIIGQRVEKIKIKYYVKAPYDLVEKYESLLLRKFPYYKKLSEKSRIKFLIRLHRFVRSKTITGREGLEVTDEMKALIGASAIQLTFGLNYYWLNHYEEIILFPDIFHNSRMDQFHKGETGSDRVVLSWKHFLEGYDDESDKLNLGLHELAHALDLSRIANDSDEYFKEYYNKWYFVSKGEYQNMQQSPSFLRAYAGVNFREFFAVCVEHFFEAPAEFQKHLPDIYRHLTILLRQDPLKTMEQNAITLQEEINTMPVSGFSETPEFSSTVSLWDSFIAIAVLMLRTSVTFFVLYFALKLRMVSIVIIILLMVYYFNALLLTKFNLFKDYLVINRPLLLNRQHSFFLENIISIQFTHGNVDNVLITYCEKGEIQKYN
ncbi:MAG TPA: zinc-dependent peptidase, partial [Bacteroidia bacterium]|nr:zinc-dependent peptidase [Bacteroidia bacterium]